MFHFSFIPDWKHEGCLSDVDRATQRTEIRLRAPANTQQVKNRAGGATAGNLATVQFSSLVI